MKITGTSQEKPPFMFTCEMNPFFNCLFLCKLKLCDMKLPFLFVCISELCTSHRATIYQFNNF